MDKESLNILGESLLPCSMNPLTGFTRTGCCETGPQDLGTHTVCAIVTEEFLHYSLSKGNDLITPMPAWNFPGLKPGDRWCLCVTRWLEAYQAGVAPKIIPDATNIKTLEYVPIETLTPFFAAYDTN